MTEKKHDYDPGPLLFSIAEDTDGRKVNYCSATLRDIFAGFALAGYIASRREVNLAGSGCTSVHDYIASHAYEYADAMKEARKRRVNVFMTGRNNPMA